MPAFETVNSILEDSAQTEGVRSIHPITGDENFTSQTYELMGILDNIPNSAEAGITSPRDVNRQAAAIAGLPPEIANYMKEYLELSEQHAAFHGHHN